MSIAFAVEFELSTPILIDRGINLAGLLARLIFDRDDPDPLPKVPLESRDGILAGSDLFVVAPALSYPLTYVRSLRPTAMQHDLALRNRRGRRMPIVRLRDEMKNLLDHRRATSAGLVVAFGCGDIAAAESLLRGIDHIGAKRSSGYGAVSEVRVRPIADHPHAGFADREGRPMRPVPATMWRSMNLPPHPVRNLVARLPRWASPYEPCVGPRAWTMEAEACDRECGG
jgi:hypothetical protein